MTMINIDRCVETLKSISAFPTAPYHEARIAKYIISELDAMGIPARFDDFGNIIALYECSSAPPTGGIALAAHMDHPAFELTGEDGQRGCLLGGVAKECFDTKTPVLIYPSIPPDAGSPDEGIRGVITGHEDDENGRVMLHLELESSPPSGPAFGVWDLPALEIRGDQAWMRAIDDIVGCAMILLTLKTLSERQMPCRCYGIFSRAEEVGFIGVTALARERAIPSDTVVVSLETSKELPEAEIGKGPVIRVGDRIMTFDGRAETLLDSAWKSMLAENCEVMVQRQLMSGGGCEGTVYMLEGYPTTGLALPLGNYHNMSPEVTIASEYISLNDLVTSVELLARAAGQLMGEYETNLRRRIYDTAQQNHARLKSSFAEW